MGLTWDQLRLGRNDRAAIIGQTGCGKTTLAEYLLDDPNKRKTLIWDPKGSESVAAFHPKFKRVSSVSQVIDEAEDRGVERLIYTPSPVVAEDENDQERMLWWVYERGYTRLYIDEATSLACGRFSSRVLTAVLNRGRERGVSTITATQRPSGVPMNILSEAQWFFIFKLLLLQDKKRVEDMTGITVMEQMQLGQYEFFVWSDRYGRLGNRVKLKIPNSETMEVTENG